MCSEKESGPIGIAPEGGVEQGLVLAGDVAVDFPGADARPRPVQLGAADSRSQMSNSTGLSQAAIS